MTPPLPVTGGPLGARALRRFGAWTIRRDLASHYRRVVYLGAGDPAPGRPLVVYANHHVHHDGYLLVHWLLRHLARPPVVWMAEWARAPLFGPLGALPFPADDPRERTATVRETARRMVADARTALIVFPEGSMHPADDGLWPFRTDFGRLARLLPPPTAWVPAGVHLAGWGESRPTLVLATGDAHDTPDGHESARVGATLATACALRPDDLAAGRARLLLDGARGPDERWDLSRLAPLIRRWT